MGNDFHPYLIRRVEVNADKGNVFGSASSVLEIPVSWYLDDFPPEEYITGRQEGMNPAVGIFDRWKAIFDYAVSRENGACYVVTTHPQTIGRAHMISRLEELIEYMAERGAWFATLSEICDGTDIAR